MRRTIAWAKRCRAEFDRPLAQKRGIDRPPQLLPWCRGGGSVICARNVPRRCWRSASWLRLRRLAARRRRQPAHEMLDPTPADSFSSVHRAGCRPSGQRGGGRGAGLRHLRQCAADRDAPRPVYTFTGRRAGPDSGWFRFLYVTDDKYIRMRPVTRLRLPHLPSLQLRLSAPSLPGQRSGVSAAGDASQPALYGAAHGGGAAGVTARRGATDGAG